MLFGETNFSSLHARSGSPQRLAGPLHGLANASLAHGGAMRRLFIGIVAALVVLTALQFLRGSSTTKAVDDKLASAILLELRKGRGERKQTTEVLGKIVTLLSSLKDVAVSSEDLSILPALLSRHDPIRPREGVHVTARKVKKTLTTCPSGQGYTEGAATADLSTCDACTGGKFSNADDAHGCASHGTPNCPAGEGVQAGTATADAFCARVVTGVATAAALATPRQTSGPGATAALPCCSPNRTRCDWEDQTPFTIPTCERDNLLTLLRWLQTVARVPFHLTWGTLLGAMRKKGHIAFESDIDVAIDRKLWEAAVRNITDNLKQTGYRLKTNYIPAQLLFSERNTVHVDLWLYDRHSSTSDEETLIRPVGATSDTVRTDVVQNDMLFPLVACTYSGDSYGCPAKSRDWLAMTYGAQWKVPRSRRNGYVETVQQQGGRIVKAPPL